MKRWLVLGCILANLKSCYGMDQLLNAIDQQEGSFYSQPQHGSTSEKPVKIEEIFNNGANVKKYYSTIKLCRGIIEDYVSKLDLLQQFQKSLKKEENFLKAQEVKKLAEIIDMRIWLMDFANKPADLYKKSHEKVLEIYKSSELLLKKILEVLENFELISPFNNTIKLNFQKFKPLELMIGYEKYKERIEKEIEQRAINREKHLKKFESNAAEKYTIN